MFYKYLEKLRSIGQLSFTLEQAQRDLKTSKTNIWAAIYRMKKQGKLFSPVQGFYIIIPPEYHLLGCLPADELIPLLMTHLGQKYYACLLTAAKYHGAAHQKPAVFQVFVDKRMKGELKCGQVKIEFFYKKAIQDLPTNDIKVYTGYLKISSAELTAIDIISNVNRSGGLNNVATIFSELIESIDPQKLIDLAKQLEATISLQRIGYILEQLTPMEEEAKKSIIEAIQLYLSTKRITFIPLEPKLPKKNYPRNKKWKIIENETFESDI